MIVFRNRKVIDEVGIEVFVVFFFNLVRDRVWGGGLVVYKEKLVFDKMVLVGYLGRLFILLFLG